MEHYEQDTRGLRFSAVAMSYCLAVSLTPIGQLLLLASFARNSSREAFDLWLRSHLSGLISSSYPNLVVNTTSLLVLLQEDRTYSDFLRVVELWTLSALVQARRALRWELCGNLPLAEDRLRAAVELSAALGEDFAAGTNERPDSWPDQSDADLASLVSSADHSLRGLIIALCLLNSWSAGPHSSLFLPLLLLLTASFFVSVLRLRESPTARTSELRQATYLTSASELKTIFCSPVTLLDERLLRLLSSRSTFDRLRRLLVFRRLLDSSSLPLLEAANSEESASADCPLPEVARLEIAASVSLESGGRRSRPLLELLVLPCWVSLHGPLSEGACRLALAIVWAFVGGHLISELARPLTAEVSPVALLLGLSPRVRQYLNERKVSEKLLERYRRSLAFEGLFRSLVSLSLLALSVSFHFDSGINMTSGALLLCSLLLARRGSDLSV